MNRGGLFASALGIAGMALAFVLAPATLAPAWLVAVTAAIGLPLGAIAILAIHSMTGGRWGEAIHPTLRLVAGVLPLTLLAMLPLFAALPIIFPYLAVDPMDLSVRVAAKIAYLAPPWMIARTVLVAAVWLLAAALIGLLPLRPRLPAKPAAIIAAVLYVLGLLVFSTDWMLALDPEYVSTIYALMVATAQLLGALALVVLIRPGDERSNDLGKLLISGILTWVYMAFMQWLINWIGDLPTEAAWYLKRFELPWNGVLLIVALTFAVVPFLALLLERTRRDPRRLRAMAALVLVGYIADNLWRLAPAFALSWGYVIALVAAHLLVGGVLVLAAQRLPGTRRAEAQHV